MLVTGHRNPGVCGRRIGRLVAVLVTHAASLDPRARSD
jgi:hypothetical protein